MVQVSYPALVEGPVYLPALPREMTDDQLAEVLEAFVKEVRARHPLV
jgi:hypothetical protein